jgi:glucose dehydrogenase
VGARRTVRAALSIRRALVVGALILLTAPTVGGQSPGLSLPGASSESMAALARGEWPTYAGTYASAKYSPLDQSTSTNVGDLKIAWRWTAPDHAVRAANTRIDPSWYHESTPIMVNGVLYTSTSLSQVVAIDAATGRTMGPMTYMAGGKQYVAFPVGWANVTEELIALALP